MELQRVYQEKALADAEEVAEYVKQIVGDAGQLQGPSLEQIRHICKHAPFLRLLRIRSLHHEYQQPDLQILRKLPPKKKTLIY